VETHVTLSATILGEIGKGGLLVEENSGGDEDEDENDGGRMQKCSALGGGRHFNSGYIVWKRKALGEVKDKVCGVCLEVCDCSGEKKDANGDGDSGGGKSQSLAAVVEGRKRGRIVIYRHLRRHRYLCRHRF